MNVPKHGGRESSCRCERVHSLAHKQTSVRVRREPDPEPGHVRSGTARRVKGSKKAT